MTKILHVTDCYLPRLGGIEIHVHDLVARQRAAGADARVVTLTAPAPADLVEEEGWVVRVGHRFGHAPEDAARSVVTADRELAELLRAWDPDVVHVHVSVFSPFATLAARRASRHGYPTLVTVHSMWNQLGPLPALAQALLQLKRWPIAWSAVSDAAARPLREMLGPELEVSVLPNAVDPEQWRNTGPRRHSTDVPTILSVMRFTRTKRALPLARILRDVRDRVPDEVAFRAILIGDGPQRDAFVHYVQRHRMASWVELPGRLDRTAIRDRLVGPACFVAPAELESFGIAALEARAAGLPVVASSRSGVGEFIRHGREGLLAPDDDQMAAAVARMITDRALREAIAAHNVSTPIEHDWDAAIGRTDALYRRASIATSRAPSRVRRRRTALSGSWQEIHETVLP